jgi:DNA-binding CsgD family transcriptional regulator/tetratricopeptide (TPR) repeat protein
VPALAERWLSTALHVSATGGAADVRDVRLARARANTAAGRLGQARREVHEVVAGITLDDPRRVDAVRMAAHLDQLLGHHHESDALLARELDAHAVEDPQRISLLVDLATTRLMRADFEGARPLAEEAALLTRAMGSQAPHGLLASSLSLHALVAHADGDDPRARTEWVAARAAVDALTDGEMGRHLEAGLWLGWAEMFLEEYAAGERHLSRCLDIARRGTHAHLLTHLLIGLGSVLKLRGELAGAAEAYDEAAEAAARTHSGQLMGMAHTMQCRAATWLGDHGRARLLGEQAVAAVGGQGGWFEAIARAVLAQARLVGGDAGNVVAEILDAGGGADLPRFDPVSRCDWWEVVARAAVLAGDVGQAQVFADRAAATAREVSLHAPAGAAALAQAEVLVATGEWDGAVGSARRSAGEFMAIDNRLELGRARLVLGTALDGLGDRAAAVEAVVAAESDFAACSAAHLQAVSRSMLRRLGRRVPSPRGRPAPVPPPRAGADASAVLATLSPREWEVARLLRDGRTNREIAAELVLSAKTVESHISHIFVKLGVSTRSAVAAAVAGVPSRAP